MNQVLLEGRLAADPIRKTVGETEIAEFSVAVATGKDREADFFDCTAFNGWAKNLAAKKGDPVFVIGRLRQERWTDKETGKARSRVRVAVFEVRELRRASQDASWPVLVGEPY
ncbi:MAG: single-stranded DNA-binding protein [Candidatus Aminicenantes bacterium]|nr:single-stranded DNA-binding protein [Candidatus Aminicenantes bacterium]